MLQIAYNIEDVLLCLDRIIQDAITQSSRVGYFACLYKKMTIAVRDGILDGRFEDGARMEALDVHFANRYFEAYYAYTNKLPLTDSWRFAFDAAGKSHTIIQHLLLGMNAHINLDLGVSAALVSRGTPIMQLKKDFEKINVVIASLINTIQTDLEEVCFPMRFVRYVDNAHKDAVINFSMKLARSTAWNAAMTLSALPEEDYGQWIHILDRQVLHVAQNILNPKLQEMLVLKLVQLGEPSRVDVIINRLND